MTMTAKELNELFSPLAEKIGWPDGLKLHQYPGADCIPELWTGVETLDIPVETAAALIEQHVAAHLDSQPFLWTTELRDGLWRVLAFQDDGLATIATGKTKLHAMVKAGEGL